MIIDQVRNYSRKGGYDQVQYYSRKCGYDQCSSGKDEYGVKVQYPSDKDGYDQVQSSSDLINVDLIKSSVHVTKMYIIRSKSSTVL